MSKEIKFRDLRVHAEVLELSKATEYRSHDILGQDRSRLTKVVPTTGGENNSPTPVGEYRLLGTILGCPKGEGFGIVYSPRRLRK